MDSTRFDRFTRLLATRASRRRVLEGLAAGTLAGVASLGGMGREAAAQCPCGPDLVCAPDGSCRQCLTDADCPIVVDPGVPATTYHCNATGQCEPEGCMAPPMSVWWPAR